MPSDLLLSKLIKDKLESEQIIACNGLFPPPAKQLTVKSTFPLCTLKVYSWSFFLLLSETLKYWLYFWCICKDLNIILVLHENLKWIPSLKLAKKLCFMLAVHVRTLDKKTQEECITTNLQCVRAVSGQKNEPTSHSPWCVRENVSVVGFSSYFYSRRYLRVCGSRSRRCSLRAPPLSEPRPVPRTRRRSLGSRSG